MILTCLWRWYVVTLVYLAAGCVAPQADALAQTARETGAKALAANRPPNILFIITDQQHANMMSIWCQAGWISFQQSATTREWRCQRHDWEEVCGQSPKANLSTSGAGTW